MSALSQTVSVSTRERLHEVAAELFAERGYAGASMSDIAKRVGVRKPSLYNYCSSKEDLFVTLLDSSLEEWSAASGPALDEAGSCRQRLRSHLHATVDFAVKNPHAMALCRLAVAQVSGEFGARVQAQLLAERLEYQQQMEAFFTEAADAGEVVARAPALLTLAWLTFLDGVLTHQLFGADDRQPYYLSQLDDLWRLFWRGISSGTASEAEDA